jgi:hypothetical protein
MKALLAIGIATQCITILFADTSTAFRDDAPAGFIHLTSTQSDPEFEKEYFVNAANIVSFTITKSSQAFSVLIMTNGTKSRSNSSTAAIEPYPECYYLEFKTKAEAMKCVARLMSITTKGEQGGGGNAHELPSLPSTAPPKSRATP